MNDISVKKEKCCGQYMEFIGVTDRREDKYYCDVCFQTKLIALHERAKQESSQS